MGHCTLVPHAPEEAVLYAGIFPVDFCVLTEGRGIPEGSNTSRY